MHEALARAQFEADTKGMSDAHAAALQRVIFDKQFPLLDVGFTAPGWLPLRLKLNCLKYNAEAPSITLHDWDGAELSTMPRPGGIFHPDRHPVTRKFFICMIGVNEYHIHPNHLGDPWSQYRAHKTLGSVLYQIQEGWRGQWRG